MPLNSLDHSVSMSDVVAELRAEFYGIPTIMQHDKTEKGERKYSFCLVIPLGGDFNFLYEEWQLEAESESPCHVLLMEKNTHLSLEEKEALLPMVYNRLHLSELHDLFGDSIRYYHDEYKKKGDVLKRYGGAKAGYHDVEVLYFGVSQHTDSTPGYLDIYMVRQGGEILSNFFGKGIRPVSQSLLPHFKMEGELNIPVPKEVRKEFSTV